MPISTNRVILALILLSLIIGMQYTFPVLFFSTLIVATIYYVLINKVSLPTQKTGNQFMSAKAKQTYLQSQEWKKLKRAKLWRVGNKCELCQSTTNLHLHHLTYERLGAEQLSDLTILCSHCHQLQHDHYGYDRKTNYSTLIKPKLVSTKILQD